VEVFSAQGRDPVAQWKLSGPVKREYDRQVRGYVYVMEGGSSTTRMQLPKSEKAMRKLAAVFLNTTLETDLVHNYLEMGVTCAAMVIFPLSWSGAAILCVPTAGAL